MCSVLNEENVYASSIDTDGNTANIVVFINFADTTHNHIESYYGKCFMENPNIEELFNGLNEHPKALRQYLYNITY